MGCPTYSSHLDGYTWNTTSVSHYSTWGEGIMGCPTYSSHLENIWETLGVRGPWVAPLTPRTWEATLGYNECVTLQPIAAVLV